MQIQRLSNEPFFMQKKSPAWKSWGVWLIISLPLTIKPYHRSYREYKMNDGCMNWQ